jgi:hypothetical protein
MQGDFFMRFPTHRKYFKRRIQINFHPLLEMVELSISNHLQYLINYN